MSLYALLYKFHLLCVLLLVQLSLLTVCFYSRAKATCRNRLSSFKSCKHDENNLKHMSTQTLYIFNNFAMFFV